MQLAAVWHCYLPLCIYILYNFYFMYTSCWVIVFWCVCVCVLLLGALGVRLFVSVHSFFSFSFLYFSLNWYMLLD